MVGTKGDCHHHNSCFHFDNPRRFECSDCGAKFADYGDGYIRIDTRMPELYEDPDKSSVQAGQGRLLLLL